MKEEVESRVPVVVADVEERPAELANEEEPEPASWKVRVLLLSLEELPALQLQGVGRRRWRRAAHRAVRERLPVLTPRELLPAHRPPLLDELVVELAPEHRRPDARRAERAHPLAEEREVRLRWRELLADGVGEDAPERRGVLRLDPPRLTVNDADAVHSAPEARAGEVLPLPGEDLARLALPERQEHLRRLPRPPGRHRRYPASTHGSGER